MRHIINMPEEDRATDIGNMDRKLGKDGACGYEISSRTGRQTDTETDILISHNTSQPLQWAK